jgi:hypothetical protein
VTAALAVLFTMPASAQRVENTVAVFAALDKVTAKISRLEVPLNETRTFGALKVTPRVCFTRAPTEPPRTTTFVEVEEMQLDGKEKPIFSGWMFADSPGLNAVEHPVFDVWLTDCAQPRATAQRPQPAPTAPGMPGARPVPQQPEPEPFDPDQPRRRRVPREAFGQGYLIRPAGARRAGCEHTAVGLAVLDGDAQGTASQAAAQRRGVARKEAPAAARRSRPRRHRARSRRGCRGEVGRAAQHLQPSERAQSSSSSARKRRVSA